MSDVLSFASLDAHWQARTAQIAKLLEAVPVTSGVSVLIVLENASAQTAVAWACAQCACSALVLAADAPPEVVLRAIAEHRPRVVVCRPEMFGWASKQAFLNDCAAIYTCAESGDGTLLDRASHFPSDAAESDGFDLDLIRLLDRQGQLQN